MSMARDDPEQEKSNLNRCSSDGEGGVGERRTEDGVFDCPTVVCFPCRFRYRRHSTHRLNMSILFIVTQRACLCRMVLRLPND